MYLTKVNISAMEAAKTFINSYYRWHQFVWKAFPERDGQTRDFLHRVEESRGDYTLYILSPQRPKLVSIGNWETREVSSTFYDGKKYAFKVRLNPTYKEPRFNEDKKEAKQGVRRALWDPQKISKYISHKALDNGFTILGQQIDGPYKNISWKGAKPITHASVEVQGVLEVTDATKFKLAATQGIGSAKGFGFGLMLLKKVS